MRPFLSSFLLLILVAATGCTSPDTPPETSEQALRYLALGDSYTIGEAVAVEERWPVQLVTRLRAEGLTMDDPDIIAKTGWTTDELADFLSQADVQGPYDMVSLLIGVNNQYRNRDLETYRAEFTSLLDTAIVFAGGDRSRVMVVSIPDWGVTPFGAEDERGPEAIQDAIRQFNAVNRDLAASYGISYVDVFPASLEAATDTTLVAEDGLHPSGAMYSLWTDAALPAARSILQPTS